MSDQIASKYIHEDHIAIFREAARRWDVYILVRQSNAASKDYIGQPGYVPKRLDCKAKTAKVDVPPYRLAGLVVSPHIHPRAFAGRNLEDVKQTWDGFAGKYLWTPAEGRRGCTCPRASTTAWNCGRITSTTAAPSSISRG